MEEDDKLRIVAVDPGNNLGVAVIDYYFKTRKFKVLDAYTLDLSRYIPNDDETDKRDVSLNRLAELKRFLKKYLKVWKPDVGAHETAYVPHRGGGASIYSYASLVENILCIKFSFIESATDARIFEINPTVMKMTIVGHKSSDKSLILKALIAREDVDLTAINVNELNQHNSDAIGIGITFVHEHISTGQCDSEVYFNFRGKKNVKRKK